MSTTIEQAEAALASANAAYTDELRRDCLRSDGSGAQERRRDEHKEKLREEVAKCERELAAAKRPHSQPAL